MSLVGFRGKNHPQQTALFGSRDEVDDRATTPEMFAVLHSRFRFTVDVAAAAQVDDVLFRMLEPREVIAAMAFPADYLVLGNRREQVRMAGNAVTPPAARDLIAAVAEALTGEAVAAP